jgi:hypothetical protein
MLHRQIHSKNYTYNYTYIHSFSVGVMNFTLPASRPNFAQVACTTRNAERGCPQVNLQSRLMNMMRITSALAKLEVKVNGKDLAVFVSTRLRRHAEM